MNVLTSISPTSYETNNYCVDENPKFIIGVFFIKLLYEYLVDKLL